MSPEGTGMTIGQLASRCGVSRDTLRFYEREGLLPPPPRSRSGYRLYDADHESRVLFVRQAQAIGFSLDDVRELLELRRLRTPSECARVAARLRARIADIDARIAELTDFRRRLGHSLRRCETATGDGCPVTLDLGAPRAPRPPVRSRRPPRR